MELANGVRMPLLGLGTWPMDNDATASAVETAVSTGYRLFDTAESYGNEAGVGEGLRRSGIRRDEVFITSKFNKEWHGGDGVARAFEASAKRLGVEYIDLFLIHWPAPAQDLFVDAFVGLEALLREGKVRSIGTSNFKPTHLRRLFEAGLTPHVNQIQLDPEHVRADVQTLHREKRIITASYSPLGRGGAFLSHPAVTEAAVTHSKTPSQVVLRWHTQQGIATASKSADPRRQLENLDTFDFELAPEEIRRINALDTRGPARLDPDEYAH
ncbi:2,5-diketo-D-gluconate reductase A [Arthrobacter sp. PvP023]|uniref:aldo/keto reductase n=1 Tax=Micrococcaceae TaxID=1268 RepID=UPI001B72EA00|nr:aldo/keto reductase [Arthrobacter sp. PvP023]MBP1136625.1 2,5-diketo-D-gluconate reductase A [Arthrobacter sp. PvP023]